MLDNSLLSIEYWQNLTVLKNHLLRMLFLECGITLRWFRKILLVSKKVQFRMVKGCIVQLHVVQLRL